MLEITYSCEYYRLLRLHWGWFVGQALTFGPYAGTNVTPLRPALMDQLNWAPYFDNCFRQLELSRWVARSLIEWLQWYWIRPLRTTGPMVSSTLSASIGATMDNLYDYVSRTFGSIEYTQRTEWLRSETITSKRYGKGILTGGKSINKQLVIWGSNELQMIDVVKAARKPC